MSATTLSVALPTYNGDRYLSGQLDSILRQRRRPDEVVISDDASTDETIAVARRYEREYPDIVRVLRGSENLGVTGNFERAIRCCTGDVIALSDQDDRWYEGKLSAQFDAFRASDGCLVVHDSRYLVDGDSTDRTLWDGKEPDPRTLDGDPRAILEALLAENFVQGATMLFGRKFRDLVLPIPDSFLYDHWIALVAALSTGIRTLEEPLMLHRIHDQQAHGAAASLLDQVRTELSRGPETFCQYAARWDALLERLETVEDGVLTLDRPVIEDLVLERQAFDRRRKTIHAPESTLTERLDALWTLLRTGSYGEYSRPGLAAFDGLRLLAPCV